MAGAVTVFSLVASHHDLDLDTVARLSAGTTGVCSALPSPATAGAVVLATCNRVEVYAEAAEGRVEEAREHLVAAIAESNLDELGLIWPREVAPADVHVVATGKDAAVFEEAERVAAELEARGLEVLYDDRPKVSPGVKFKDAELLGMPLVVVVGRGFADGKVELRNRLTGETEEINYDDAVATIESALA